MMKQWSHLNGYTYHVQTYNPPGPDHLTPGLYGLVAQEVLKQCDGLGKFSIFFALHNSILNKYRWTC